MGLQLLDLHKHTRKFKLKILASGIWKCVAGWGVPDILGNVAPSLSSIISLWYSHISEDVNPHQDCCENLRSCMNVVSVQPNHSCLTAVVMLQLSCHADSHSSRGITMWIANKQKRCCAMVGIETVILLTVTIFTKWWERVRTKLNSFWIGIFLNIEDCKRGRGSSYVWINTLNGLDMCTVFRGMMGSSCGKCWCGISKHRWKNCIEMNFGRKSVTKLVGMV